MNFNAPLLRPVRILLFPFSLIYAFIIWLRNKFFDKGWIGSSSFNLPLIGIGNLSAGGTGKSPMVEFIISKFRDQFKLAVLSRGYKRKTSGYALANGQSTALEIGDEPLQFYRKFPGVSIAVGEERIVAIPQLLHDKPETEVIILDDAFQHRYVTPGLNILLTDFNNLFTRDWFLPTGDLRDLPSGYKRADILIVSKCPAHLSEIHKRELEKEINPLEHQHLFFTSIDYGTPYHLVTKAKKMLDDSTEALLVSGIANPKPLKKYLADNTSTYFEMLYSDHHIFTIDDLKDIRKRFDAVNTEQKMIITTEKDAMRLDKFKNDLVNYPVYVIPIEVKFLFDGERRFTELITNFITTFSHKNRESDAREETI
ncbi:MAG: tetraacyldisaccharide 4'-kinase [Chitinophagaceae bacterium]|nr:tetraacyldisaccharide 4'-kinase [Chitinophagaceae bacterium]